MDERGEAPIEDPVIILIRVNPCPSAVTSNQAVLLVPQILHRPGLRRGRGGVPRHQQADQERAAGDEGQIAELDQYGQVLGKGLRELFHKPRGDQKTWVSIPDLWN